MSSFRKATRAGTKALICLYAESGGGKTLSALLLARGLAGPGGRIGMIDTENRRGEFFADDKRIGGYEVQQLEEPFSPARYMQAVDDAEREGFDVLVIDSGSHEWEGIGGVLDMAVDAAGGGQPQFGHWKKPKEAHKHLLQKLMRCKAHVIICLRAHYKSRQIKKEDYEAYGIKSNAASSVIRDDYQSPIQDERFIFEMTVHLQMTNTQPGVPHITKCPEMLLPAFEVGKQITVQTGERMRAWYDAGSPAVATDPRLVEDARANAAEGLAAYTAYFTSLSREQKAALVDSGEHAKNKLAADKVTTPYDDNGEERGDDMDATDHRIEKIQGDQPAARAYVEPNFDSGFEN